MEWIHQGEVEETVGWFCARTVPDAGNWAAAEYDVEQVAKFDGRARRVGVSVPTSSYDLWLNFVVEEPDNGNAFVSGVHAVRSGRAGDEALPTSGSTMTRSGRRSIQRMTGSGAVSERCTGAEQVMIMDPFHAC